MSQLSDVLKFLSQGDTTSAYAIVEQLGEMIADTRGRYAVASAERIHMDAADPVVLPDLLAGDTLATAGVQYLAIRVAMLNHGADAPATVTVGADHRIADPQAAPSALVDTLPHLITSIGQLKDYIIAHGNAAGVHFHDDTSSSGTGFTLTVDPPVSQANCNTDINDLKHAINTHFGKASF